MSADDPWRLDGRIAVVIGAAGGIGAAACRELVQRGCRVVAVDIDPAVHELAGSLGERWAVGRCGDAGRRDVLDEAMSAAETFPGELGVLVHAAHADRRGAVEELADDQWDLVQEACLASAWRAGQAFVRGLDGAAGAAVFVSSVHAYGAFEHRAPYAVAKAGLLALVRAMAVELGPRDLRVNAVAPGFVQVPRNQHLLEDQSYRESLRATYPLRRVATPEDVARVIVFLATPAAGYVHGACVPVDGGLLAQTSQRV